MHRSTPTGMLAQCKWQSVPREKKCRGRVLAKAASPQSVMLHERSCSRSSRVSPAVGAV
jgi:hypothetical protein